VTLPTSEGGVCAICRQPRTTHAPSCPADTSLRSSQAAIDTARKPRQIAVQFTKEELDEMTANAQRWMSGPEGQAELKSELLQTSLIMLQIKKKLAFQPPAERSGVQVQNKAVSDYIELAEQLMKIVGAQEKKGEEVDPS
jgi:hypothetical protein